MENENTNSSENQDDKKEKEEEIILRMREFEITQLVQRNNFFMVFQGVMLAGVIQSSHTKPIVSFLVCFVGFLVSLLQVGMASGAKFWQEYWEAELSKSQPEIFHENECKYRRIVKSRLKKTHGICLIERLILHRYSVGRIPIWVAIIFSAIWLLLVLCTLRSYPPLGVPSFIVGFEESPRVDGCQKGKDPANSK